MAQIFSFVKKFDFGVTYNFFEKNLTPKKCIFGGENEKKSKFKRGILEGNEKLEKRKRAYFSPNVRGKGF